MWPTRWTVIYRSVNQFKCDGCLARNSYTTYTTKDRKETVLWNWCVKLSLRTCKTVNGKSRYYLALSLMYMTFSLHFLRGRRWINARHKNRRCNCGKGRGRKRGGDVEKRPAIYIFVTRCEPSARPRSAYSTRSKWRSRVKCSTLRPLKVLDLPWTKGAHQHGSGVLLGFHM